MLHAKLANALHFFLVLVRNRTQERLAHWRAESQEAQVFQVFRDTRMCKRPKRARNNSGRAETRSKCKT
jgi:hypothetical protein